MPKFLADENFNGSIVRGLQRGLLPLDLIRVQDVNLSGRDDTEILQYAANEDRVLLTHDVQTIPGFAYQRIKNGLSMPGVVIVPESLPIGKAIEDLLLLIECNFEEEWKDQVRYLPL